MLWKQQKLFLKGSPKSLLICTYIFQYYQQSTTKPRTGDASIRKPQCVRREEVRTARAPACSQTHLKHQKVLCEVAGGGRKLQKDNAEKCLSKFWCLPKILTNIPTILKACVD